MAIFKLLSDNPNFSWVIQKNPEKNVILRTSNYGHFLGFFIDGGYCVYFRDDIEKTSYRERADEFSNGNGTSAYTNARIICDIIKEIFKANLQKVVENDVPSLHKFSFNLIFTNEKTFKIFSKYFIDYEFIWEKKGTDLFNIEISNKTPKTLNEFLKVINLFAITAAINSSDYIYIEDSISEKYIKMLSEVDAPYFIRYLFKLKFTSEEKRFQKLKTILESSKRDNIKFVLGNTHDARISFIKKEILEDIKTPILDFGVGKDYRYLRFLKDRKYFGIEKDEDALFKINRYIEQEKINDIKIFESLEKFIEFYNHNKELKKIKFNIVCTEVLEHNNLEEVETFLENLKTINYKNIIITVPNFDFNKNYVMETKFRHPDHKWEMNTEDFKNFIGTKLGEGNYNYSGIGDQVNGESVSICLKLSK